MSVGPYIAKRRVCRLRHEEFLQPQTGRGGRRQEADERGGKVQGLPLIECQEVWASLCSVNFPPGWRYVEQANEKIPGNT